jgi:DNA-binding transcriptional LysR family regulator
MRALLIKEDRVQAQLERDAIDPALMAPTSTPKSAPPRLHARHLLEEQYVCALRHDHPDAAGGSLSLDRFCALDHALVSYAGGSFSGVSDATLTVSSNVWSVAITKSA